MNDSQVVQHSSSSPLDGLTVKRQPSVRQQVTNAIRARITDMTLPPGHPLIERELCEATGASRASVREALRQLETEGLVVSKPHQPTRVTKLSRQEAVNLYELRAVLEGMAGRLFAERANDKHRKNLTSALKQIEEGTDDPQAMLLSKKRFYSILFEGAGNPELCSVLDSLHRRVTMLRVMSLSQPGRLKQSLDEIRQITDATMNRNADLAAHLCAEHVANAARTALSAFDVEK